MPTLKIELPEPRFTPLTWVTHFIFDRFDVEIEICKINQDEVIISQGESKLILLSSFPDLCIDKSRWAEQIPNSPLAHFDRSQMGAIGQGREKFLPILFGEPHISYEEGIVRCHVDIFGAIFFMLSRFEEVCQSARDKHDRFLAVESLAWKNDFLYRPLADEYVEFLWVLLGQLWPELEELPKAGSMIVSCDVDEPFDRAARSLKRIVKTTAGDILKRQNIKLALKRSLNFSIQKLGIQKFDPCYTFDWYMDMCEQNNHKAIFYFIADRTDGIVDGDYDINDPRIIKLIREIHQRGHKIGMHGSYNTYQSQNQLCVEREKLAAALARAGVDQVLKENRQHYLRWDTTQTPDLLENAGFLYDSTGGYADQPGFRYGTAREFPMWSWKNLSPLNLRQRPLIVMEGTILSTNYLGLDPATEAMELIAALKQSAMASGGVFSLLWHNSEFLSAKERNLFCRIIAA